LGKPLETFPLFLARLVSKILTKKGKWQIQKLDGFQGKHQLIRYLTVFKLFSFAVAADLTTNLGFNYIPLLDRKITKITFSKKLSTAGCLSDA